jgi:hypothetical protein
VDTESGLTIETIVSVALAAVLWATANLARAAVADRDVSSLHFRADRLQAFFRSDPRNR